MSYWVNFIIVPFTCAVAILALKESSLWFLVLLAIVLHLIGERCIGKWQNLVDRIMGNREKVVVAVALLLSAATYASMLFVTWSHNPQCEFHCEGVVHWKYWLSYCAMFGIFSYVLSYWGGFVGLLFFNRRSECT